MTQNIFVKEDIIPGTQKLDGYRVVVHNIESKQFGSWHTDSISCEIHHNFDTSAYELEVNLTLKQGYNKVELDFIYGDRFQHAWKNKIVINTTRRITNKMQELIANPQNKLLQDVTALRKEHSLPETEGEERKDERVNFADALENWFDKKIPDTNHSIWYSFLRETVLCNHAQHIRSVSISWHSMR